MTFHQKEHNGRNYKSNITCSLPSPSRFPHPGDDNQLWECCFLIIGQYISYLTHAKEMPLSQSVSYKSYCIMHPAYLPKSKGSIDGSIPFYGCKVSEDVENKGRV